MKRKTYLLLFIFICLFTIGCNKKPSDKEPPKIEIPQININVSELIVGEVTEINITNYNFINDFFITASPTDIVSISTDGKITALKEGNVTITVTYKANNNIYNSTVLTVLNPLPLFSLSIDKDELDVGDTANLAITNYDSFDAFIITTSASDIVSISNSGEVTALKEGDVTITLTHKDNKNIYDSINVKVNTKKVDVSIEENLVVGGIYDLLINGNTDFSLYDVVCCNSDNVVIGNGYIHCLRSGAYCITVYEKNSDKVLNKINIIVSEQTDDSIIYPEFNVAKPYAEVGSKISVKFKNGYTTNDFDFFTDLVDEFGEEQVSFDAYYRLVGVKPCLNTLYARLKTNHAVVISLNYEFTTINPKIYLYRNKLFINEVSYVTVSNFEDTYEKVIDEYFITTDNNEVIGIDGNKITALKPGSANIILTSVYNELVSSTYPVEVLPSDEGKLGMKVVENYTGVVSKGEQFHLEIYNGTNITQDISKYTLTSSNEEIIRVTSEGLVTMINEGYGSVVAYETGNPSNKVMLSFDINGVANIDYIARLLHLALNEKGYVERQDPITGEYVNDTKYNHWYNMDGAWCAMFVSWCWYHAGLSNELLVKYCSCSAGKEWCENKGIFHYKKDYTPKSGDIVFFLSSGSSHTGIVVYCDGTYIYTIEGNASNRVDVWRWSCKDARITGYASPNYPSYEGTRENFSWIKEVKNDGTYWWNNVSEKHEMV